MKMEDVAMKQRQFYRTHQTKSVAYRKLALKKLRSCIREYEHDIYQALYDDLHKSKAEAFMSEIGLVLAEITYQLRHMDGWAKPKRAHTPLAQFYAQSFSYPEPYGIVLVMAPWNYPFQLCMIPLIGALAAGNCVVLKPSAYAPATSSMVAKIVSNCFRNDYVSVIEGGREANTALLEQRFDYIFFTGGVSVGKLVMEKASRFVTPVTLELGGKSPCIVDATANIHLAAKRIVFGKFLNAGQTCVAPDYILVAKCVKRELLCYLKLEIMNMYGEHPLDNAEYPKIINEKHVQRLLGLLKEGNICIGGQYNDRQQIEPTVLDGIKASHAIMQEEIFGPLLPLLEYEELDEAIAFIEQHEKPLALYVFTRCAAVEQRILKECSFGGGCINDTIIHLATSHMGFGGVGQSGMGAYHGYASFQTFSHQKSIVKKANWIDLPFRYPPYTICKHKMVKLFLK